MARLPSSVPLLSPEIQTVGVGAAKSERGTWYCVVDPVRGRGEPIVIYPTANQNDVPISFAGGPDIPDTKSAAGYPVSVLFPPKKQITGDALAVHAGQGKSLRGAPW